MENLRPTEQKYQEIRDLANQSITIDSNHNYTSEADEAFYKFVSLIEIYTQARWYEIQIDKSTSLNRTSLINKCLVEIKKLMDNRLTIVHSVETAKEYLGFMSPLQTDWNLPNNITNFKFENGVQVTLQDKMWCYEHETLPNFYTNSFDRLIRAITEPLNTPQAESWVMKGIKETMIPDLEDYFREEYNASDKQIEEIIKLACKDKRLEQIEENILDKTFGFMYNDDYSTELAWEIIIDAGIKVGFEYK